MSNETLGGVAPVEGKQDQTDDVAGSIGIQVTKETTERTTDLRDKLRAIVMQYLRESIPYDYKKYIDDMSDFVTKEVNAFCGEDSGKKALYAPNELFSRIANAERMMTALPIILGHYGLYSLTTLEKVRVCADISINLSGIVEESSKALHADFEKALDSPKDYANHLQPEDRHVLLWMMQEYVEERLQQAEAQNNMYEITKYSLAKKRLESEIIQAREVVYGYSAEKAA